MEDVRMNALLQMALDTAKTDKWYTKKDFKTDDEIEAYVEMVYEIKRNKRKNVVWYPE